MNRRTLGISLLLPVLLSPPACSYLFVTPPRENRQIRDESCTVSPVAPAIDTLLVSTNVASALYVASEDNVKNKGAAVGLGLGVAAFWLSSAIYGYYNTGLCRDLLNEDAAGPYSRPVPSRARLIDHGMEPVIEPQPTPPPSARPIARPPSRTGSGSPTVPQEFDSD